MYVSEEQLNHFKTFGFVIFRQIFTPEEINRYRQEMDEGLNRRIPGGVHDGKERFWACLIDDDTPFVRSFLDDDRFVDSAEQLLGRSVLGVGGDSNYYVGDTQWHPDNRSAHHEGVKFTVYLDPVGGTSGALRVIPGSHKEPYHSAIQRDTMAAYGLRGDQIPAYAFDSRPGDALVFNTRTWHAAFGGSSKRRMSTIQYYADPQTPEAVLDFKAVFTRVHDGYWRKFQGPWFPQSWRQIDDPRHQRWVRRLDELEVLETPVAV